MSTSLADMPADDVAQATLEWEQHAGNNASGAAARLLAEHTAFFTRRDLRTTYCRLLTRGVGVRWAALSADTELVYPGEDLDSPPPVVDLPRHEQAIILVACSLASGTTLNLRSTVMGIRDVDLLGRVLELVRRAHPYAKES